MKILYQIPSLDTVYAGRTIYYGYKNAFENLGHIFKPFTASDNSQKVLNEFKPDILIAGLNSYTLKYLDLDAVKKQKKKGMKVFINTPFWNSPKIRTSINEVSSLSKNKTHIDLIKSGTFGDIYYNVYEKNDPRMNGFEKKTGYKHYTIPLAADKIALKAKYNKKFQADVSFIGTYSPQKRNFLKRYVFPLAKKKDLKLYGQDWTFCDRTLGWIQRTGQYLNIPYLRSIRKPQLQLNEEAEVYKSSLISINIHEDQQRKFGGDCNERTFKIPLCGGFEITDDVACIRKYFEDGKEIIIAKNEKDWFEKIEYYIKNPEKKLPIIEAGRGKILLEHTYHNRVEQIISIYNEIK